MSSSPPSKSKIETSLLKGEAPDSPNQECPQCKTVIDVTGHEPLSVIVCPGCLAELSVRGWIQYFKLLEVAGRGGMGVVYRGMDTRLDRPVAIKLLRRDHSNNEKLVKQLETEAAITGGINHSHVIRVYTTGVQSGLFFIAMELADKGSLEDLIAAEGRVAEGKALDIGIQIASGLRAAHEHGLIHRDIKPGNILFSDSRTAKIVDFGLAIFMDQEEAARGEIWGSPYYIAPEKLDYKPEDFRSDIYSLGATLYHALAGRPPFEAETPTRIAMKHVKSQPVSLQSFAPWVSGATAYVVNRTLSKDPDQRYQSYGELIEHLEYAREEFSARTFAQETGPERLVLESDRIHRFRGWLTFAMIAVILAIAGAAFVFRDQLFRSTRSKDVTASPTVPKQAQVIFRPGLEKLALGDGASAATAFRAAAEGNVQQPDLNWITLCEGLAELVAGRRTDAQAVFRRLAERGLFSTEPKHADLATFFYDIGRRMADDGAIDLARAKDYRKDSHEAMALLLFGMKNWELARVEEGAAFFHQFRSSRPEIPHLWIEDLKPLATRYTDDFAKFQAVLERYRNATSAAEKVGLADALKNFPGPLGAFGKSVTESLAAELALKLEAQSSNASKRPPKPTATVSPVPLVTFGSWSGRDIGNVKASGGTNFNANTGTASIQGSGKDIYYKEDAFHFMSQPITGDVEIIARVLSLERVHPYSRAAIMFRAALDPGSPNVCHSVTPDHGILQQIRPAVGEQTTATIVEGPQAPIWLKFIRRNNTATGYYSADGKAWTKVTSDPFAFETYEAGLAVTSHQAGIICTADFDHIQVYQPPRDK